MQVLVLVWLLLLLIEVVVIFGLVEVRKQIGMKGIHVGCSWDWEAGDKVKLLGISIRIRLCAGVARYAIYETQVIDAVCGEREGEGTDKELSTRVFLCKIMIIYMRREMDG